jgi:hypothetical protein
MQDPQPFGEDFFSDDYEEDSLFLNDKKPVKEPVLIDVHHNASVAKKDRNTIESDNKYIEVGDVGMCWELP